MSHDLIDTENHMPFVVKTISNYNKPKKFLIFNIINKFLINRLKYKLIYNSFLKMTSCHELY